MKLLLNAQRPNRFVQSFFQFVCLVLVLSLAGCGSSQGVTAMNRITLEDSGFVLFGEANQAPVFLLISERPADEVQAMNSGNLWSAMRGYNTLVLEHKDGNVDESVSTADFKVLNYNKAGELTRVTVKDQPGLLKKLSAVIKGYSTATPEELATSAIQLKELVDAK